MKSFLYLLILLSPFFKAESQQFSLVDQKKIVSDINLAMNSYKQLMATNYDLINGKEYVVYHKINHSNPFFKSATLSNGCIYTNEKSYCDFKIFYDIFKNELVVNFLNPSGYLKLACLNQHFVDSFDITIDYKTSRFLNLTFGPDDKMEDGLYEIGYRGKTELLLKHMKYMIQVNSQDEYIDKLTRYLYINGQYQTITSLRKFCRLFGEKQSLVKNYIKSMGIYSFRKITDGDLVEVLSYYDRIYIQ